MDDITIAVTLAGILVLCSTFPQVILTLRTRKTRDISLLLTVFAVAGLAFYVYYAIRTEQWIFAIADGIDMSMWVVVCGMKSYNVVKKNEKGIIFTDGRKFCMKYGHFYMGKFEKCLICNEEKGDTEMKLLSDWIVPIVVYPVTFTIALIYRYRIKHKK